MPQHMLIIWKAAFLGVVEGLTEFLPVSSTAHLLLVGQWLHHEDPGGVFTVLIQLGSILAVMWLYRAKSASLMFGCLGGANGAKMWPIVSVPSK